MNITFEQRADIICKGIGLRVRGTVEHALVPETGNLRIITRFNNNVTMVQEVLSQDVMNVSEDRLIQALTNHLCVTMIQSMFKEEYEKNDKIIY